MTGALTIERFCDEYGLGRTKAYAEIGAGRIPVRKCGNRTLILREDAEQWARSLPIVKPRELPHRPERARIARPVRAEAAVT